MSFDSTTYHDSGADGDGSTAVRVWNNVAVPDRQKRDRRHPHRVENVRVTHVMVAAQTNTTYQN